MFPAYHVPPSDLMEVVFTISELQPEVTQTEIEKFSDESVSERKVREALKIGREIGLVKGETRYNIPENYQEKIVEVSLNDRDVVLKRALIQYRPFRSYLSYIDRGYTSTDAAQKATILYDIDSDPKYVKEKLESLGEYSGILTVNEGTVSVDSNDDELPGGDSGAVQSLRNALDSEVDTVLYLERILGQQATSNLDDGIEEDLIKAFEQHDEDPRNSITAAGRAIEDYLQQVSRENGSNAHLNANGFGHLAQLLNNDGLLEKNQNKRAQALSSVRNKGGGHGKDRKSQQRWDVTPEIALDMAMSTTLLIRSVYKLRDEQKQIL